ncbi:MAG: hypothetical protein J1F02_07810 [Lachnospiraceae bacterium]|nr:hypothetical protein [Lachnospiraceae bacterium]
MKNVKEFMQKNNLSILAEIDVKDNMYYIYKTDQPLAFYSLFEQLILFNNIENLLQSLSGQILPALWSQGNTNCIICQINKEKLVCVFYDAEQDVRDKYAFAQRLNEDLVKLLN